MKTKHKLSTVAAAAAMAVIAGSADALTYGFIPDGQTNEVLAPLGLDNPLYGYYGANLYLTGAATLTATLLGYEAGNTNTFSMTGTGPTQSLVGGGGTAVNPGGIASITGSFIGGLLDFVFSTSGGGTVQNGANPDNTQPVEAPGVNFFVSFVQDPAATFGQSVYLFFDDDGASNDDNHDDLVVRLDVTGGTIVAPVPVPAAGGLLVLALGGLAALRRRRTNRAV